MGSMEKAKRKTPAPPPAKVDVFNGPAPAQALTGLAQRFSVEYQAAISLKPGGWFVFERAPTKARKNPAPRRSNRHAGPRGGVKPKGPPKRNPRVKSLASNEPRAVGEDKKHTLTYIDTHPKAGLLSESPDRL